MTDQIETMDADVLENESAPGTAVALVAEEALPKAFGTDGEMDKIVRRIEDEVRSQIPDVSTVKGRAAIKSLAFKVTKSKTAIDKAGKALTEEARKLTDAVNADRRMARERLDALADETRAPLTKWEEVEEARIFAHKSALSRFDLSRVDASSDSELIRETLAEVEAIAIDDSWEEFIEDAAEAQEVAAAKFVKDLAIAEKREADAAELEALRAAAAERARQDEERAAREFAEAEAAAQVERDRIAAQESAKKAEQEHFAAEAAEAERKERETRDRIAAVEQARKEAEEAAVAREAAHKAELAAAAQREEQAAQRERDRIAAEQEAEADARAKREADKKHRARIVSQIEAALFVHGDDHHAAALAIVDGKVAHVEAKL